MTQLFNTNAFDSTSEEADQASAPGRHLRSIPTWQNSTDLADRITQWRLDEDTIETGRRGIALARQALQDSAKTAKPRRKAA